MNAALLVLGGFLAAAPATPPAAKPSRQRCPVETIEFTKEAGCHNDGYVRFCARAGNKGVRAAIKRIAPTAEKKKDRKCLPGGAKGSPYPRGA